MREKPALGEDDHLSSILTFVDHSLVACSSLRGTTAPRIDTLNVVVKSCSTTLTSIALSADALCSEEGNTRINQR